MSLLKTGKMCFCWGYFPKVAQINKKGTRQKSD